MRQVTHALLTRPPLNCLKSIRKLHSNSSVRLACVKHAASVHPEPGSNSHVKMVFEPVKISLANLTVLTVLRFLFFISLKIFWNFQGCITVYLSRCFAVVFNQLWYFITVDFVCQQLFLIFLNSFRSSCRAFMPQRLFIITHCFQLVKHFFELFFKARLLFNCRNGYWFYQNRSLLSSTFFFFFWRSFFAPHLLR